MSSPCKLYGQGINVMEDFPFFGGLVFVFMNVRVLSRIDEDLGSVHDAAKVIIAKDVVANSFVIKVQNPMCHYPRPLNAKCSNYFTTGCGFPQSSTRDYLNPMVVAATMWVEYAIDNLSNTSPTMGVGTNEGNTIPWALDIDVCTDYCLVY